MHSESCGTSEIRLNLTYNCMRLIRIDFLQRIFTKSQTNSLTTSYGKKIRNYGIQKALNSGAYRCIEEFPHVCICMHVNDYSLLASARI